MLIHIENIIQEIKNLNIPYQSHAIKLIVQEAMLINHNRWNYKNLIINQLEWILWEAYNKNQENYKNYLKNRIDKEKTKNIYFIKEIPL